MAKEGTETVLVKRKVSGGGFYGDEDEFELVATIERCIIWPRGSVTGSERGMTTIEGLHIFTPPDGPKWEAGVLEAKRELATEDKVVARGKDWQMEGAVGDWRKKSGNPVGYLFEVGRWSG